MPTGRPSYDPAIAKVVERQMRNWEIARAQRLSVPSPQRKEVEDFLCISRGVGAGGKEVATMLGQRLGWPVFDKEILDVMAGDDHLRRRVYESMDERDLSWHEETLDTLMHPEVIRNDYFHRLSETILSIARQGRAVFLGRGAGLILPKTVGFRVRLVAPIEKCVENFAKENSMTLDQARSEVARLEQERAEFIHNHFRADAADPAQYDLVINLDRLTTLQAVEMMLSVCKFAGIGA